MNIKSLICSLATLALCTAAAHADLVPTGKTSFGPLATGKAVPEKQVKLEATLYYQVKDTVTRKLDWIALPQQLVTFTVNWKSDHNGSATAVGNQKTTNDNGKCATSPKVPKGEKEYLGKHISYYATFAGATLQLPGGGFKELRSTKETGRLDIRSK